MSLAAQMPGQKILKEQHAPMFPIDLTVKDLGYLLAGNKDAPVLAAASIAYQKLGPLAWAAATSRRWPLYNQTKRYAIYALAALYQNNCPSRISLYSA